jgi:hypothetical protein
VATRLPVRPDYVGGHHQPRSLNSVSLVIVFCYCCEGVGLVFNVFLILSKDGLATPMSSLGFLSFST